MRSYPNKISGHGIEKGTLYFKVHFDNFPPEQFNYIEMKNVNAPQFLTEYCESIGLVDLSPEQQVDALMKRPQPVDWAEEQRVKKIKVTAINGHEIDETNPHRLYLNAQWSNGDVILTPKSYWRGPKKMLRDYKDKLKRNNENPAATTPTYGTRSRQKKGISKTIAKTGKATASSTRRSAASSSKKSSAASDANTPTTSRNKVSTKNKNKKTPSTSRKDSEPMDMTLATLAEVVDAMGHPKKIERAQSLPPTFSVSPAATAPVAPLLLQVPAPLGSPSTSETQTSPSASGTASGKVAAIPKKIIGFEQAPGGSRFLTLSAGEGTPDVVLPVEEYRKAHPHEYLRQLEELAFGSH